MTAPDPMSGSRDFLAGAGEMATLMRAYDWTTTPLVEPEGWPSGLRTAVRLLLNSHHPMHIFWGPEATFFYNDAFGLRRDRTAILRAWPSSFRNLG